MPFYKLFCLIHRRTDYYKLIYKAYYMMHPEKRKRKEESRHAAVQKLAMMNAMVAGLGSSYMS